MKSTSRCDRELPVSRQQLIDQVSAQFPVERESIRFGDMDLDVFRVRDPDSLLDDEQLSAGHDEIGWQPYWAQAWDAASAMAHRMAGRDFRGVRVLDLGCGLGITGAVIAARGGHVTLADYVPPALEFARINCWPWRDRTKILRVDWKKDRLDQTFDLIVGADILYDRNDIEFLDGFWRYHLAPGGHVLHGDPHRAMTVEFLQMLERLGWRTEVEIVSVPEVPSKLRLVELRSP